MRLCVGLAAGIAVAWVDNFAFEGEVSPIVIVVMLLAATATIAAVWVATAGPRPPLRGCASPFLISSNTFLGCRTP